MLIDAGLIHYTKITKIHPQNILFNIKHCNKKSQNQYLSDFGFLQTLTINC